MNRIFVTCIFIVSTFFVNVVSAENRKMTEIELVDYISSQELEYPHYKLGTEFLSGKLVKMDYDKALFWLAQSSELESYDKADYLIAEMYIKGLTLSGNVDYEKAKFFYQRSSTRGNKDAKIKLATYLLFNEYLYNQKEGLYWLNESMKDENQTAIMLMYLLSLDESDLSTLKKEILLLKVRSEKGDSLSSFAMGYLYLSGKGVDRDLETSKDYFLSSMITGNIISEILVLQIDKIVNTIKRG